MNSNFQYLSFIFTLKNADAIRICAQIIYSRYWITEYVTSCYPVVVKCVDISEPYRPVSTLTNFMSLSGFKLGTSLMHTHVTYDVQFGTNAARWVWPLRLA
jgi:hypothetical protein